MAFVCLCEGVPERDVRRAIDCGATDIDEVGQLCGAGINCHGCHATIEDLLDERPAVAPVTDRGHVVIPFPGRHDRPAAPAARRVSSR